MAAKVKICGLKTAATLEASLAAGADYVGLVLYPPSPRDISLADAATLATLARGKAQIVALLVDPTDDLISASVELIAPDMLQLHGSETPARAQSIRQRTGCRIMKAIKVETAADAAAALAYRGAVDLVLFDAKPPRNADRPGGHGTAFDWSAIDAVKSKVDFMLSGGLNSDNVAEAVRRTGAPAVDVSSGVETRPGEKDIGLIRRFVAAAKSG